MSPETRFQSLVVGATVSLMFAGVMWLSPFLVGAGSFRLALGATAGLLASAGTYRLLATGLSALFLRVEPLKAWLLGPSYLHGTWVSFFQSNAGDTHYIIEWYEQSLSTLTIRGASYTEAGDKHAQWVSQAAFVDAREGRVIYTYTGDILRYPVTYQGVGVFQFERSGLTSAPTAIEGYAADLIDGVRTGAREEKAGRKLLSKEQALPLSRKIAARLKPSLDTQRIVAPG
jgi:hypothetical protein